MGAETTSLADTFPKLLLVNAVQRGNRPAMREKEFGIWQTWTWAQVLEEVMGTPEKGIPLDLMQKAHCVIIVPGVKKVGFIVGGRYGKGVAACRGAGGKGWTGPSTVRIEGGSVGLQIGGSHSGR